MDSCDSKDREASVVRRLHQWNKGTYILDIINNVMTLITYNMSMIYIEGILYSALSLIERGC